MHSQIDYDPLQHYIIKLVEYFDNCNEINYSLDNLGNIFTSIFEQETIEINIPWEDMIGENDYILQRIFIMSGKINFARHLIKSPAIKLDVAEMFENKSILMFIADAIAEHKNTKSKVFKSIILSNYRRGYTNKPEDEKYIKDTYKKIKSQDALESWCYLRVAYLLGSTEEIEKVFAHENLMFTLLSFRMRKPVGMNFSNLISIANNGIEHYRKYGDIILKAITVYNVLDEIKAADKKLVFDKKTSDFHKYKPVQDTDFNEILFKIFPELR